MLPALDGHPVPDLVLVGQAAQPSARTIGSRTVKPVAVPALRLDAAHVDNGAGAGRDQRGADRDAVLETADQQIAVRDEDGFSAARRGDLEVFDDLVVQFLDDQSVFVCQP